MQFWVFPIEQPGTIRLIVGQAENPNRCMIRKPGSWVHPWSQYLEFWAYPRKMPGTVRIAVGEAQELC